MSKFPSNARSSVVPSSGIACGHGSLSANLKTSMCPFVSFSFSLWFFFSRPATTDQTRLECREMAPTSLRAFIILDRSQVGFTKRWVAERDAVHGKGGNRRSDILFEPLLQPRVVEVYGTDEIIVCSRDYPGRFVFDPMLILLGFAKATRRVVSSWRWPTALFQMHGEGWKNSPTRHQSTQELSPQPMQTI